MHATLLEEPVTMLHPALLSLDRSMALWYEREMPRSRSHDMLAQLHCCCYLIAFTTSCAITHTYIHAISGSFTACHPQGQEILLAAVHHEPSSAGTLEA